MVDVETSLMSACWRTTGGLRVSPEEAPKVVDTLVGTREGHIIEVEREEANYIPFIVIYKSLYCECPLRAHGPTPVMRRTPTTMASKTRVYIL